MRVAHPSAVAAAPRRLWSVMALPSSAINSAVGRSTRHGCMDAPGQFPAYEDSGRELTALDICRISSFVPQRDYGGHADFAGM